MSGSAQGSAATKKAVVTEAPKNGEQPLNADKKPAAQLEEDDEFEDFPVEGTSLSQNKKKIGGG
jgi:26 proteasome complex subunit DSS1